MTSWFPEQVGRDGFKAVIASLVLGSRSAYQCGELTLDPMIDAKMFEVSK